jgi:hypothetical protein
MGVTGGEAREHEWMGIRLGKTTNQFFDRFNAIVDEHLGKLSHLETKVLMVFLRHSSNETGEAWPAMRTVAAKIGQPKQVSRVRRAVKSLEAKGFLTELERGGGQGNSTVRAVCVPLPKDERTEETGSDGDPVGVADDTGSSVTVMGVVSARKGGPACARTGSDGDPRTTQGTTQRTTHTTTEGGGEGAHAKDMTFAGGGEATVSPQREELAGKLAAIGFPLPESRKIVADHKPAQVQRILGLIALKDRGKAPVNNKLAFIRHGLKNGFDFTELDRHERPDTNLGGTPDWFPNDEELARLGLPTNRTDGERDVE